MAAVRGMSSIGRFYLGGAAFSAAHLAARGIWEVLAPEETRAAPPLEDREIDGGADRPRCDDCEYRRRRGHSDWPLRIQNGGDVVLSVVLWPMYLGAVSGDYFSRIMK